MKIFFTILIVLTFCSYVNKTIYFDPISKKEMMNSWAWKIFIFTDEAGVKSTDIDSVDIVVDIKDKPIFVEDMWEANRKDDLFFEEL